MPENADRTPRQIAGRLRERADGWRRETFTLPREQARAHAAAFFARFPKQAYMTEVESWRALPGDAIEFTMRRLPTAD
jgi:hypothetical protein